MLESSWASNSLVHDMVLAVFEFFGFGQNSCFSLCLFRSVFLFEKSLGSKYLQYLALKEKSIIFIIVATKSTKLLQNEKLKVFFFFSAARSLRNSKGECKMKKISLPPPSGRKFWKKLRNLDEITKFFFTAANIAKNVWP